MLVVHEVHAVAGRHAGEHEALYRDVVSPSLADGSDARLLWYLHQAHGTGPAYTVVVMTAVASTAAWTALADRWRGGDLAPAAATLDGLCHDVRGKLLEPLPWSPWQEIDLAAVPATGAPVTAEHTLFMEDTAWPHRGRMDDYVAKAGTLYVETLARAASHGRALLELVGAFRPLYGAGHIREVVLWQRVGRPDHLLPLLTREVPAEHRAPGTWMHDALDVRDQWESRLLRTASWSPLS